MAGYSIPAGGVKDGTSFDRVEPMSRELANTMISEYMSHALKEVMPKAPNLGLSRSYLVLEDIPSFESFTEVMYLGVLKHEMHWINAELLPPELTDSIQFTTETVIFERTIPTVVPQFGVANLSRSRQVKMQSKALTYASAITMEGEVYDTASLNHLLYDQMMQIVGANLLLLAIIAYTRLLECTKLQFAILETGRTLGALKAMMNKDIDMFAMPYKYKRGMYKFVHEHSSLMRSGYGGVNPTHCIMQPNKMRIIVTGSDEYAEYSMGGQKAVDRSTGDGIVDEIAGVRIREGPCEYNENTGQPISIGYEVYTADHHEFQRWPDQVMDENDLPYIGLYDIEQDEVEDVRFIDAFKNNGRFVREEHPTQPSNDDPYTHLWKLSPFAHPSFDSLTIKPAVVHDEDPFFYWNTLTQSVDVRPSWHLHRQYNADCVLCPEDDDQVVREFNANAFRRKDDGSLVDDPFEGDVRRAKYEADLKGVIDKHRAQVKVQNDVFMRATTGRTLREWSRVIKHILVRPMRGNVMQSSVFAAGGVQLGRTYYKPMPFVHGKDVTNNSHVFRNQMRAVVHIKDPYRVSVAANASYDGVLNGGNNKIIDIDGAIALADGGRYFANDLESDPSIYSICVPMTAYKTTKSRFATYEGEKRICIKGVLDDAGSATIGDYPGYRYYNIIYGWNLLVVSHTNAASAYPIATISCRGWSNYPTASGRKEITGTGHHGMYEMAGVRNVRHRGMDVYSRLM